MYLTHFNDGKGKYQSHAIGIKEDDGFFHADPMVFSHDITDVSGYGESKEEALEELKKKVAYLMEEYTAFYKMLTETDTLTNNIVEVDCFGKLIDKK